MCIGSVLAHRLCQRLLFYGFAKQVCDLEGLSLQTAIHPFFFGPVYCSTFLDLPVCRWMPSAACGSLRRVARVAVSALIALSRSSQRHRYGRGVFYPCVVR
jgi:hypothetical protein